MERRCPPTRAGERPTPLPADYLKLAAGVFATGFQTELEQLAGTEALPTFEVSGGMFPNEVRLSVALLQRGRMGATTVHASVDFALGDEDPAEAAAAVEACLSVCVDAIGAVFGELLAPERLPRLRHGTLATLSEVPPGWSPMTLRERVVHVLVDSANPALEKMADDWLAANEPAPAAEEPSPEADGEGEPGDADDDDDTDTPDDRDAATPAPAKPRDPTRH